MEGSSTEPPLGESREIRPNGEEFDRVEARTEEGSQGRTARGDADTAFARQTGDESAASGRTDGTGSPRNNAATGGSPGRVEDESSTRGNGGGDVDRRTIPLYDRNPRPPYPRRARERGEEGTVMLRVLVDTNGRARKVRVHRSSGSPRLDGSAVRTVRDKWWFRPAMKNGEPVARWCRIPIKFTITMPRAYP